MAEVLLVEDDDDLREDLALLIRDQGFQVVTAANGREALDRIGAGLSPCLVILDLMMPVMDGWAFRDELLNDPQRKAIPIVILSGVSDIRREARLLRAVGYLTKPIDLDRLFALLNEYCRQ